MQFLIRDTKTEAEFVERLKAQGLTPQSADAQLKAEGWIPLGNSYYKPEQAK